MSRMAIVGLLLLGMVGPLAAQDAGLPTAKDVSVPREVPTPIDTISLEQLKTLAARNASAEFDPNRVITPHMPIAVRQEGPKGPSYQEGVSYTFLIHSVKFASMCRLGRAGLKGQLRKNGPVLFPTQKMKDAVGANPLNFIAG
jgi:hypothetical protein